MNALRFSSQYIDGKYQIWLIESRTGRLIEKFGTFNTEEGADTEIRILENASKLKRYR